MKFSIIIGLRIRISKRNIQPSFNICYIYVKSHTTIERRIADACNTVGNSYARKSFAKKECILADDRDAVGDSYACKSIAIIERRIADVCDTITDCYARKSSTTIERTIAYACDTVRDSYTYKSRTIRECSLSNACNPIPRSVILEHSGNNKIFVVLSFVTYQCSIFFCNLKTNRNNSFSIGITTTTSICCVSVLGCGRSCNYRIISVYMGPNSRHIVNIVPIVAIDCRLCFRVETNSYGGQSFVVNSIPLLRSSTIENCY